MLPRLPRRCTEEVSRCMNLESVKGPSLEWSGSATLGCLEGLIPYRNVSQRVSECRRSRSVEHTIAGFALNTIN